VTALTSDIQEGFILHERLGGTAAVIWTRTPMSLKFHSCSFSALWLEFPAGWRLLDGEDIPPCHSGSAAGTSLAPLPEDCSDAQATGIRTGGAPATLRPVLPGLVLPPPLHPQQAHTHTGSALRVLGSVATSQACVPAHGLLLQRSACILPTPQISLGARIPQNPTAIPNT